MAKPTRKTSAAKPPPTHRTTIVARSTSDSGKGEEHREFPRANLRTKFLVTIPGDEEGNTFAANLMSDNLSVSGVYLESTFFLAVGKEVFLDFELPTEDGRVRARAVIVREEHGDGPRGRSGFALRFLEFFDQTEVALAKIFLGERLRSFAAEYLKSRRAKSQNSELGRVTDALAAWELLKITAGRDVWRG